MNPGKLVDAYGVDENLRISPDYKPRALPTYFSFAEDGGSFAAATERCFGMGKCRRTSGGTMCPSFMATREEKHTTRGRAHLLFELVRGEVIGRDGWREPAVKEALDLCLACKGCKADCPVSVDIASYKAEFLAHWYEGRRRPPAAYAMGLIDVWARLAARAPWWRTASLRRRRSPPCSSGPPAWPRARPAALRADVVRQVGAATRDGARRRHTGRPVGGHVHERLPSVGRAGGSGGARGVGLSGSRSVGPPVLRPPALRLWHARPRTALPATGARRAPRRPQGRFGGGRPRAELPRRLQGRAGPALPRRRGRAAAPRPEHAPLAAPARARASFEPTPLGRRAPCTRTAISGAGRRRARHRASRQDRRRGRRSERRLLWSRRLLRLRAGRALRRLDEGRRARAPPRSAPRRRRRWSSRAASPAASRSPTRPTGALSTSPRSSASRSAGGSSRRAARGARRENKGLSLGVPKLCRSVHRRIGAATRNRGRGRPRGPWPKTRVCPYVSRLRNDSSTVARGRGRVRVAGRRRPRGASARGRGTRGRGFAPRRAALRAPPDQVSARSRPAARRRRRRASSPGRRRARRAGARSSSCAPRIRVHARPSSASLRSSASVTG